MTEEVYLIDVFGLPTFEFKGTSEDACRTGLRYVYATPEIFRRSVGILRDEGICSWCYGYNYLFIYTKDGKRQRDAVYKDQ